jgi:hypothetical protein
MDTFDPADPINQLPADAYHHLIESLRLALPPADTPDAAHRRDRAAIAQIAALCPANAAEAVMAAQFVLANAQAIALAQHAPEPAPDARDAARRSAQSASMMRQARDAMRLLLRMQAARTRRDADPATADQAAWAEHTAARWMLRAVGESHDTDLDARDRNIETSTSRPAEAPGRDSADDRTSHAAQHDLAQRSSETIMSRGSAAGPPAIPAHGPNNPAPRDSISEIAVMRRMRDQRPAAPISAMAK